MSSSANNYLNSRVLKLNVGFLLSEGPGNSRSIPFDIPSRVKVEDDLFLQWVKGELLLTRTKEGILVQGTLTVAHMRECDRCLDEFLHVFDVDIEELFAHPADPNRSVFGVDGTGHINLAHLLREEVLIEESYRVTCKEDCAGINAETGEKRTRQDAEAVDEIDDSTIDPRMAILKQLLESND